jgi:RND family efflux transporter MFP subunit
MNPGRSLFILAAACSLSAQTVQVVKVESSTLDRSVKLSGEFRPFLQVDLHARVPGFVEKVLVDRGSLVRQGDLLASLSAPEMEAQVAEAEAKARAAESAVAEAKAKVVSVESTFNRLKEASATPGAISGNELVIAEQTASAARGVVSSAESYFLAAKASLMAVRKMEQYRNITAPFSGVITERLVHPGALAGPNTGALLRLEQVSRLRLVVAVPEANFSCIRAGMQVPFQVSAHPARTFDARVARIAHSVDSKTRTMSVELDVANASGLLAPGMYPQLDWPVRSTERVLAVPATSVVRTTERVFVIRVENGRAEWINVRMAARLGERVQVLGDLSEGDVVVRNGTDEIREGAALNVVAAGAPAH